MLIILIAAVSVAGCEPTGPEPTVAKAAAGVPARMPFDEARDKVMAAMSKCRGATDDMLAGLRAETLAGKAAIKAANRAAESCIDDYQGLLAIGLPDPAESNCRDAIADRRELDDKAAKALSEVTLSSLQELSAWVNRIGPADALCMESLAT